MDNTVPAEYAEGQFFRAGSGILAFMLRRCTTHLLLGVLLAGTVELASSIESAAQVIQSGPSSCPGVALTFDLCPVRKGSGYDQPLMDYLITHRIPATFFMSGKWMAKHQEQVDHLLGMGFFEVGTHGDVHAHLPMQDAGEQRAEIVGPVTILYEITMPMKRRFSAPLWGIQRRDRHCREIAWPPVHSMEYRVG